MIATDFDGSNPDAYRSLDIETLKVMWANLNARRYDYASACWADTVLQLDAIEAELARRQREIAVPAAVLRRWDRLALPQVCVAASELAEQNDQLRRDLARAEDLAEAWRENALELAGDHAGLTINGTLVRLESFDGRPFAEPGSGHRTDGDTKFAEKVAATSIPGPRFLVDGNRITLTELVRDNSDDDEVCEWARTAQLGERFPAFVHCERVS